MIEFIKLGLLAQIVIISGISSIVTLIIKKWKKELIKEDIYKVNAVANTSLVLLLNLYLVVFEYQCSVFALLSPFTMVQLIVYIYTSILLSQLFYDKAKEIIRALEIDLTIEILYHKIKEYIEGAK